MAPRAKKRPAKSANPFVAIWNWFLAPRRASVFDGEETKQSKRKRRGKREANAGAKISGRAHTNAVQGAAKQRGDSDQSPLAAIAAVDKRGKVRFQGQDRILFQSAKGSKAAALTQAAAHFAANQKQCTRWQQDLASQGVTKSVTDGIRAMADAFAKFPGLAETPQALAVQEAKVAALVSDMDAALEHNRKARQAIIATLEDAKHLPLDQLSELVANSNRLWAEAGEVESIHLSALERRLTHANTAAHARAKAAADDPAKVLDQRARLLDDYAELLAEEDEPSDSLTKALEMLAHRWRATNGLDQVAHLLDAQATRYARQAENQAQAQATLMRIAAEALANRTAVAGVARTQLTKLVQDAANTGTNNVTSAGALAALDRQLNQYIRDLKQASDPQDRSLIMQAQSTLAAAHAQAQADEQRRAKERAAAEEQASKLLDTLALIHPDPAKERNWSAWDAQHNADVDAVRAQLEGLPPRIAKPLRARLAEAKTQWSNARTTFFDQLDQGRETSQARKTAIVDRLMHYPEGLSAKEIDTLLSTSMQEWKQAGTAPRDQEEELWQSFLEVRQAVAAERDAVRDAEKGEHIESMADAFIRKRERLAWLEWLSNHDRYLARQKSGQVKAKDWVAKDKQIAKLRKDVLDIQRKLNKASPLNAKAAVKPVE